MSWARVALGEKGKSAAEITKSAIKGGRPAKRRRLNDPTRLKLRLELVISGPIGTEFLIRETPLSR
jgi:hypothetical protein